MKVTKELQEVFKKNKNLKKVYFDEDNNHYFSKHEIDLHEVDEDGISIRAIKVYTLPGAKKAPVKIWVDRKKGKVIDKFVNTEYKPVHSEMTREEVLSAKASTNSKSDEQKLAILLEASDIMKDKSNLELLKSLR